MKKKRNVDSISISKFLRIYYGITDEVLLTGDISHKAIKQLIPDLKRLPFDYAYKNEDLIASGDIVLVNDSNGNIIPYKTPDALEDIDDIEDCLEATTKEEKAIKVTIEIEGLNLYQLSELCKNFKKNHRIKEYRFTYRILKAKKIKNAKTKKYRMRRCNNDKY